MYIITIPHDDIILNIYVVFFHSFFLNKAINWAVNKAIIVNKLMDLVFGVDHKINVGIQATAIIKLDMEEIIIEDY